MTTEQARTELAELRRSLPYAWAMGHSCTTPDHPRLRAIREREANLLTVIAGRET